MTQDGSGSNAGASGYRCRDRILRARRRAFSGSGASSLSGRRTKGRRETADAAVFIVGLDPRRSYHVEVDGEEMIEDRSDPGGIVVPARGPARKRTAGTGAARFIARQQQIQPRHNSFDQPSSGSSGDLVAGSPVQAENATKSERPSPEARADRVTGSHGREHHEIALLEPAFRERIAGREGNRSGGGIAVLADIHHHLFHRKAQSLGRRVR